MWLWQVTIFLSRKPSSFSAWAREILLPWITLGSCKETLWMVSQHLPWNSMLRMPWARYFPRTISLNYQMVCVKQLLLCWTIRCLLQHRRSTLRNAPHKQAWIPFRLKLLISLWTISISFLISLLKNWTSKIKSLRVLPFKAITLLQKLRRRTKWPMKMKSISMYY